MQPNDKKGVKSRRSFLNMILGSSLFAFLASVIYPLARFLIPPKARAEAVPNSVIAGTLDDLKPNSGEIIKYGSKPVILIRTEHNDVRAFSAVCTHLECIVQYRSDLKHIWCACHNGHYDLNGINIAGPPPRPLTPYKVNVKNDKIYVSKET
jgi:Rieske Fe-S protein